MAAVRDAWGVVLKFPERTCKECLKYPCFVGIKNVKSDLAKFGCIYFRG